MLAASGCQWLAAGKSTILGLFLLALRCGSGRQRAAAGGSGPRAGRGPSPAAALPPAGPRGALTQPAPRAQTTRPWISSPLTAPAAPGEPASGSPEETLTLPPPPPPPPHPPLLETLTSPRTGVKKNSNFGGGNDLYCICIEF